MELLYRAIEPDCAVVTEAGPSQYPMMAVSSLTSELGIDAFRRKVLKKDFTSTTTDADKAKVIAELYIKTTILFEGFVQQLQSNTGTMPYLWNIPES